MLNILSRALLVILILLFTPLAFVLCISQLFGTEAMFSFWHILSFWVLILIFRLCLVSKQKQPVITLGKPPQ